VLKADRPLMGTQCGVWGLPGQSRMEGRVIGEWLLELKRKSVCRKGDFQRYGRSLRITLILWRVVGGG
jgi:hypothetical protein